MSTAPPRDPAKHPPLVDEGAALLAGGPEGSDATRPRAEKKSVKASERDRPDVQAARAEFVDELKTLDASRCHFIDEAASHIAMTRERARAPAGTRVIGKVIRNRGTVTTMIGALTMKGLGALMTVEGGTTGNVFIAFVQACLVPTLKSSDVVVMDNLAAHKVKTLRRLIEAAGARVLFLPAYSPDLNPIEECWSNVKANLRRIEARNVVDLRRAVGTAADLVTGQDAVGWIDHAGSQVN
jgi:transposase